MKDSDRGFWEVVTGICMTLFFGAIFALMIYGWITH